MSNTLKVLIPAVISFCVAMITTPLFTHYFYKYKLWRRTFRNNLVPDGPYKNIHDDTEMSTPRVGGMIIWFSVIFTLLVIFIITAFSETNLQNLNFINRKETLLPFFALIVASIIGLGDDFVQIFARKGINGDPIFLRYLKILIIIILGIIIGWWFYNKLGISYIKIPFDGLLYLGPLFIPVFIFIMLAVFSSSVIDGIDGLSGGVLGPIFLSYTIIAFTHGQYNLAALCAVITSGILAFLWFNIPPARFYMGETGMIGLTVVLSVIAFLTNTVLLLPIIAFPLFATSLSVILQLISKKFFNRKIFKVAPLHHHFEAIGWPKAKVTMRYWIISIVSAIIGVVVSLIS